MKRPSRTPVVVCLVLAAAAAAASLTAQTAFPSTPQTDGTIRSFFLNTGVQPLALGDLQFFSTRRQTSLVINTSGLTPGTFDVSLNGALMDRLVVNRRRFGTLVRRANGGSLFRLDPRGMEVAIESNGIPLLMAVVPDTAAASRTLTQIEDTFDNTGGDPGLATALFSERGGLMNLRLAVAGSAEGTLDVMADGTRVGGLQVGRTGFGTTTFDSRPFSSGFNLGLERLLTFDPRGSILTLERDGLTVFQTTFPQFAD
jgi:hypothetical protein